MADGNDVAVVEKEAPQGAESEVEAPRGSAGAGEATPAIDPNEYEQFKQNAAYWNRVEQLANTNPHFRTVLEKAWKGEPLDALFQPQPKPEPKKEKVSESDERLKTIQERLEKFESAQQAQMQEAMRREKFAEVQSETDATFKKFEANEADQKEFWNRYGQMIQREAFDNMQRNPQLTPQQATNLAYSRHSSNIGGEYALLMEDKLMPIYAKRLQDRNNPLKGIASPADKAGKDGTWPTTQERFVNAIKNEKDSMKRAEMYKAYAQEIGVPVESLFRSSGG